VVGGIAANIIASFAKIQPGERLPENNDGDTVGHESARNY
jgi:hypothetical protein